MTTILGISAFYHDSAAALVRDGDIVAAAQEERFTRKKHDPDFPQHAVEFCLKEAGCALADVDHVVFYDKPFLKFERLLETYLSFAPKGFRSFSMAMPVWLKEKLFQKKLLTEDLQKMDPDFSPDNDKLLFTEHHLSHAASAFFPSPFEDAVVLTMDGVGEWATTSVGYGHGNDLEIEKEIHYPHSLGLLYSAFTYYTGFKVNSGEYKVMGLAPYGTPRYKSLILDHLIDVKEDGSFKLDQSYFDYCTGLTMTNKKFNKLFGGPPRDSESPLEQKHMDLAASVQAVIEDVVLKMTASLAKEGKSKNLCLAGGVALNCVANGKILKSGAFENIWVQPAAGDAGGALGAALAAYHLYKEKPRQPTNQLDHMKGSYLGPQFEPNDVVKRIAEMGGKMTYMTEDEMLEETSTALARGKAIGWFQGRMEFGPRALGGRSIIADARSPEMQKTLNLKVKFRESFRPFAPSVLREDVADYFDFNADSPYMLMVDAVNDNQKIAVDDQNLEGLDKLYAERSQLPAVTHVDYSARIQTVHKETNPLYHELISRFKEKTGSSVVVNTSFNVRGEPIVCTPEDAFRCFMGTHLDMLVVGNCVMHKDQQDPDLAKDYKDMFDLD